MTTPQRQYKPQHAEAIASFVLELHANNFQGVGYEGRFERGNDLIEIRYETPNVSTVIIHLGEGTTIERSLGGEYSFRRAIQAVTTYLPHPSRFKLL